MFNDESNYENSNANLSQSNDSQNNGTKVNQYSKYQKQFKLQCIFSTIGAGLALFTILLLVVIPYFQLVIPETAIVLEKFSIIDLLKNSLKGSTSNSATTFRSVISLLGYYQIGAFIYLIIGSVMIIIDMIKKILGIINIENYALDSYDKIKNRIDTKKRTSSRWNATRMFISGISLEVLYIFFIKYIFSAFGGNLSYTEIFEELGFYCNSISPLIIIFIIFAIATFVFMILSKNILNKVKFQILREDYKI